MNITSEAGSTTMSAPLGTSISNTLNALIFQGKQEKMFGF